MTDAVRVEEVSKRFRMYADRNQSLKGALLRRGRSTYEDFWALRDVSLSVPTGSTYGLIGENGSGKSTLLKCIARILEPDRGHVRSVGRVAALLELGSGFHPELSGRDNVYLNGSILGLSKRQLDARFDEIVDFSGIESFIDQPVKNYSSGMYVRLGFAVAINVDPDVLLVDEVLAVGDAAFQRKCEERFASFRSSGRTVVLVSHAMSSMRTLCDTIAWLDHGTVQSVGPSTAVVDDYVDDSHEDRVVDDTAGTRWGSGEVQITGVDLLDAAGTARTSFRTGDSVTVRTHFTTPHRITNPVFGIAVETSTGVYLAAHNSRDGESVPEAVEGDGHVDLVIDRLVLQDGVFDLSVAVTKHDCVHVYDYRKRLLRFDVSPGQPRESGGLVVLGGRWALPVEQQGTRG